MAGNDPIRTVVRIIDGATFPETRFIGARWRQKNGRGHKPYQGFALLPTGADPIAVAARWREADGYSTPFDRLALSAQPMTPPKRRAKMAEVAALSLPKQLDLIGGGK
jgi:hypothetical protein